MARVVFLGTPRAAVPALERLAGEHDVGLVVTQPDRPRGRSGSPVPPPVKEVALQHGLAVAQPRGSEELFSEVSAHGTFDVGAVVAYGRILRPETLGAPEWGMVNVHFSLLPRWRGAAPVARALMAGDTMTGVTIMKLEPGLDTGPILTAQAVDIHPSDNAGTLTQRLADTGASLLAGVLPGYLSGEVQPVPQTDEGLTHADKIEKADRPIDPSLSSASVVNQVRGLAPSPAATLDIDGRIHKILETRAVAHDVETGTWSAVEGKPVVGLGEGAVELISLQPPGKTPQPGADWLNGQQRSNGVVR